ncbi:hypothetical protein K504DRAFT_397743 [Pleomassaria siparia CBS 279.74]|uniref:DUF3074 domain-containing protein n=1 Tax=Pleomassaria siparia CBS 279.74 TaxID=1314801 RepID=A0A6G1KJE0_9PLEO|nr:hypothetical protein K504DRAFT_397743 [Pleomassaria siparia CBS 279.74]
MTLLHSALEALRPKDFADIPVDDLKAFLSELFVKAELVVNSVPPPPNGTPYELSKRTRTDVNGATSAADLTVSQVRRPLPAPAQGELQKAWGKPVKMSAKDNATGISVFKMAGHDRHGAWFARTSVHEGLGFAKWKRAMQREFPESLAVEGGPGVGNIRGIGGDKRLEDITVDGMGKLEVYQLSAQFPGPTAPREFITLLLTSENGLTDASKVGNTIPRHYMVISIPITHPDAPPRNGLVLGVYESVEIIREIPLASSKSASTSDLHKHDRKKSRERGGTIGFAESRGPDAKGENIDRADDADGDDPEANPVEWIMITRSDPGGGIPRFMVERNTPSSIVTDAGKFLNWACAKDDFPPRGEDEELAEDSARRSLEGERKFSISEQNGIMAGIGSSIADRPMIFNQHSQNKAEHTDPSLITSITQTVGAYVPDSLNPLQRTNSISSSTLSVSSSDSFASAEQFTTASGDQLMDDTLSTSSGKSVAEFKTVAQDSHASREIKKIESKNQQLAEKLEQTREKLGKDSQNSKSAKELEKAIERHDRALKKQADKHAREMSKIEARRKREAEKVLARQQKEDDKSVLQKLQRERSEWKEKAEIAQKENALLKEQMGHLQMENTALVARIGKTDAGVDMLRKVREELEGKGKGRNRASSRASAESKASRASGRKSDQTQVEPWNSVEGPAA